jgi:hypothetical protein
MKEDQFHFFTRNVNARVVLQRNNLAIRKGVNVAILLAGSKQIPTYALHAA